MHRRYKNIQLFPLSVEAWRAGNDITYSVHTILPFSLVLLRFPLASGKG